MDIFASLSCFLSSTEDGLPEKNRSINDNEKRQVKQTQAPFKELSRFSLMKRAFSKTEITEIQE